MTAGDLPAEVAFEIAVSLRAHAKQTGNGTARADGIGYAVPEMPSGRESFSPDASYYTCARPLNPMRFVEGAPDLAVEVRSENDYGPAAERDMAEKRADYFLAGTLVVWDVDPLDERIDVYRALSPTHPRTFRRGDVADAEPAVPGLRLTVNDLFQ